MTDRLELRGLRAYGYHGVLQEERRDGQVFGVDLTLELDTGVAARSDDLVDTVDYSALARGVVGVVEGEPVALIETLAERIARLGLADPRVAAVEVSVHKPSAPVGVPLDDVVVTIRRSRG